MENNGGSNKRQYGLPDGARELQDLIEHRGMNFALGNIFKACYRQGHCEHSDGLRDMKKIAWFAQREIERIERDACPLEHAAERYADSQIERLSDASDPYQPSRKTPW